MGFKRKADEDNQIYDWQEDERAYDVQVKQWQKNNDVRTRMLASAEASVVKTNGAAQKKVFQEDAEAKKKVGIAQVKAIQLVADSQKNVNDAETARIKVQTKLLEFDLEQKQKAAGMSTSAEQELCAVPLAIFAKSKPRKPLTREQMDNNNRKATERRAEKKKNKENAAQDL